ncbi:hypothetical protein [Actinomadura madurae]|uniref:hypothetical protein n=1 Tax=Actinomadura madurae TaxID=1993 RepID=UPI0020D1FD9C|nr:hypothetical protein [Actinomadura madurae]MCQ0018794.1 hypothetical protein [Actinomadura madurae]
MAADRAGPGRPRADAARPHGGHAAGRRAVGGAGHPRHERPGEERAAAAAALPTADLQLRQWYAFDPWLRMRAELRDGSVLELVLTDRVRKRKYNKRNPRGKVKLKFKTKTVHLVRVTRRLAKDAPAQRPGTPPPPWLKVQVKQGNRMVIRANAKFQGPLEERAIVNRVLDVSTEPFRWTPPGATARRAK